MKKTLTILIASLFVLGCECDQTSNSFKSTKVDPRADKKIHFVNENFIVESKGVVDNHFTLALRSISHPDTVIFYRGFSGLSNEKYFSTKIGDTLFFEFIKKSRFFKSVNKIELNSDDKIRHIEMDVYNINNKLDSISAQLSLVLTKNKELSDSLKTQVGISNINYKALQNNINKLKAELWQRNGIK